jgi:hypothetical protein
MWAKKTFVLPYTADAELLFFGNANAISINRHAAPKTQLVPSTGWMRVGVPAAWLRRGANEVVFSGGGRLLIENSLFPDRSARSTDGGATWQSDEPGSDGVQNGEYAVRLRLKAYALSATLTSNVVDLLDAGRPQTLHAAAKIGAARLSFVRPHTGAGTHLVLMTRQGSTPLPSDPGWSAWKTVAAGEELPTSGRYLQYRVRLQTSTLDATPSFAAVTISAAIERKEP